MFKESTDQNIFRTPLLHICTTCTTTAFALQEPKRNSQPKDGKVRVLFSGVNPLAGKVFKPKMIPTQPSKPPTVKQILAARGSVALSMAKAKAPPLPAGAAGKEIVTAAIPHAAPPAEASASIQDAGDGGFAKVELSSTAAALLGCPPVPSSFIMSPPPPLPPVVPFPEVAVAIPSAVRKPTPKAAQGH